MDVFAWKVPNTKNGSEVSQTSKRITEICGVDVSFAKCLKESNPRFLYINRNILFLSLLCDVFDSRVSYFSDVAVCSK